MLACWTVNSLRPRQNWRYFADDIFKCIFLNENAWISLKISLKFVPKVRIDNIPVLVQILAWRRPGDKPLSGPMMVTLLTHICVTRPQWVNALTQGQLGLNFRSNSGNEISFFRWRINTRWHDDMGTEEIGISQLKHNESHSKHRFSYTFLNILRPSNTLLTPNILKVFQSFEVF